MERITSRIGSKIFVDGHEIAKCGPRHAEDKIFAEALDTLCAYECAGLTPDEVINLARCKTSEQQKHTIRERMTTRVGSDIFLKGTTFCWSTDRKMSPIARAMAKLASYEDSGLTPDGVVICSVKDRRLTVLVVGCS